MNSMKGLVATTNQRMTETEVDWPTDAMPSQVEQTTRGIIASRVMIGAFIITVSLGTLIALWPILLVGAAIVALSLGIDAWPRRRRTSGTRKASEPFAPRLAPSPPR